MCDKNNHISTKKISLWETGHRRIENPLSGWQMKCTTRKSQDVGEGDGGPFLPGCSDQSQNWINGPLASLGGWHGGSQGRRYFSVITNRIIIIIMNNNRVGVVAMAPVPMWASVFRVKFNLFPSPPFPPLLISQPSRPVHSSSGFDFSVFWRWLR